MTYTAVIKQVGSDWIGWIEEIPGVNCQEGTRDELEETLRITLQEAIVFNREQGLAMVGAGYQEFAISV
jgi:predicted RNase H-like HicB family nuclease